MYFLGRFYIEGIGCFPNEQEGLNWIRKAKDKGYKDAIEFLRYIIKYSIKLYFNK